MSCRTYAFFALPVAAVLLAGAAGCGGRGDHVGHHEIGRAHV